jgi:hypothetical protein
MNAGFSRPSAQLIVCLHAKVLFFVPFRPLGTFGVAVLSDQLIALGCRNRFAFMAVLLLCRFVRIVAF